mgnify:CR=1 FL=1
MYRSLLFVQVLLPIAFISYTYIIYLSGNRSNETRVAKIALSSQACNKLFIAVIIFIILQLLKLSLCL